MKQQDKLAPDKTPGCTKTVKKMTNFHADKTDPQGSYTGCPVHEGDLPVQDADDL